MDQQQGAGSSQGYAGNALSRSIGFDTPTVYVLVLAVDMYGTIVFASPSFEHLTDTSQDRLQGSPLQKVLAGWKAEINEEDAHGTRIKVTFRRSSPEVELFVNFEVHNLPIGEGGGQLLVGVANESNLGLYRDTKTQTSSLPTKALIPPHLSKHIYANFLHLMRTERLYENPNIHLTEVADKLNVKVRHLSYSINCHAGERFNKLTNHIRIGAYKRWILDTELKNESIEDLVNRHIDFGFGSYSSFYRAVKSIERATPKAFVQACLDEATQSKRALKQDKAE